MDEEAINTLKVILEEATETDDSICYVTSGDADALKAAIKALEQTKWIPVSERLPEIGQRILVTYNQEDEVKIDITYYTKHGFLLSVVKAWMPLPQSYKAEKEENVCKDCYYNDGEVHAECVICDKAESEHKE